MKVSHKKTIVSSLKDKLAQSNTVIVINPHGLTVSESTNFRKKLREANVKFYFTKNTLAKLALKDTDYEDLGNLFKGPTAIIYSEDSFAASKAIVDYSKTNDKIETLGGVINKEFLDANKVKQIGSLPSMDELRGKIVGLLKAPQSKLVRVISAYSNKE